MKFPTFSKIKMSDTYKKAMDAAKRHNKEHGNDETIMYCPYCGKPLVKVEGRLEPLETLIEHVSCTEPSMKSVYKCPDAACIGRYAMWSASGSMYIDFPEEIMEDKEQFHKLYKFVHLKSHFLKYNLNAINSFDYMFDLDHPIGIRDNQYYIRCVEKLCKLLHLKTILLPVITANYTHNRWGERRFVSYKLEYYIRDQERQDEHTYTVHQSIWNQFKGSLACAECDYREYMHSRSEEDEKKYLRRLYGYRRWDGSKCKGFVDNIVYNIIVPIKYGWLHGVKCPAV